MITIQQDALNSALNAVTRASTKSSLMAAFSLVRLDVNRNGILHLSCFNGETAARAITNVDCDEDLSVSVDAATLKAVVETLAGEIRLSVAQNSLVIQGASNRTTLRIVDGTIPVIGGESLEAIAAFSGIIFRSLARVLPFASTDDSRAVLQVLHLMLEAEVVTAQTADGYSAGYVREAIEGPAEPISVSLPLSFARLLATLVEERDTVRMCTSGDNRYIFQIMNADDSKDLTLATVTSAENFPCEQIMNLIEDARNNTSAHLNLQQTSLMQSIRMVNAMGTQTTFIKVVNGVVKIASAETETGQARNILEGTASGDDASLWLSAVFLKRAVEACKGELAIRIANPKGKKPILVEAGSFTAVIMPIMVEGGKDPFPEDEAIAIALPEMAMA
jgi:DNA polymerase III sliding clamp (beta) subunit (PCNA family)